MKYRTFIKLFVLLLVGSLGVAGFGMVRGCKSHDEAPVAPVAQMDAPGGQQGAPGAPPADPNSGGAPGQGAPAGAQRPELAGAIGTTTPLTDAEKEIISQQQAPLTNGDKTSDGRKWNVMQPGFRVEFRADTAKGSKVWNRAKVAYTGDQGFSERWDFKADGSIKRRVDPNGSDNYTQEYRLKDGAWLRNK